MCRWFQKARGVTAKEKKSFGTIDIVLDKNKENIDGCRSISSTFGLMWCQKSEMMLSYSVIQCALPAGPLSLCLAGGQPCPQGPDVHVGLARTSSPTLSKTPPFWHGPTVPHTTWIACDSNQPPTPPTDPSLRTSALSVVEGKTHTSNSWSVPLDRVVSAVWIKNVKYHGNFESPIAALVTSPAGNCSHTLTVCWCFEKTKRREGLTPNVY